MDDQGLEEQGKSKTDDNECEFVEIDILNDPIDDNIASIKQEPLQDQSEPVDEIKPKQVNASAACDEKEGIHLNAFVDSDNSAELKDKSELTSQDCLQKVQFTSVDEGIPDENDVYKRFYFESDHLALKDNAE